jgi:hypothetical protein
LLDPSRAIRQSAAIFHKNGDLAVNPIVVYDPVARTITLMNPSADEPDPNCPSLAWLTDDFYNLQLDPDGFRAIDGQSLDPATELTIGIATTDPVTPSCATIDFCRDVLPIFALRCHTGSCHGAPDQGSDVLPAAGLILNTKAGVENTAIGVGARIPAHGANTGALARTGGVESVFGVDAPIIEPGDPGNSWLMYKLLLAVPSDPTAAVDPEGDCERKPHASIDPKNPVTDMGDSERAALSDFVLGREMPFPSAPGGLPDGVPSDNPTLTLDQLERVRMWIAQGAELPEADCTCPRGCMADADCSDQVCDPGRFTCDQCMSRSECHLGEICQLNKCVPGCSVDSDCPSTEPKCNVQDAGTSLCVQCLATSDCTGGKTCQMNSCQ